MAKAEIDVVVKCFYDPDKGEPSVKLLNPLTNSLHEAKRVKLMWNLMTEEAEITYRVEL